MGENQAGSGQPVNGALPSLPSPTMPTFNMAAQTPNGQPGGTEAAVYTNGIPQSYPGRKLHMHIYISYSYKYIYIYVDLLLFFFASPATKTRQLYVIVVCFFARSPPSSFIFLSCMFDI